MKRISLLLTLTILLGHWAFGQAPNSGGLPTTISPEVEAQLERFEALTYANYGDRKLELDLYRPKSAGSSETLPAIVCIHGGGWWRGERRNHANLAKALAAKGYVAATITYRLSGEAPFPAQIHDCKAAVRFLRANAEKYGINPDKIGAIGLSAGGHLTALLATSGGVEALEGDGGNPDQSSTIQAAVPLGAQTDFRRHHQNIEKSPADPPGDKPNIWLQFMGARPSEAPEKWKLAAPITHLDADDPPIYFITGEKDNETTHAGKFRKQMDELEIPNGLKVIPGAPHAFPGRQKWFDEMLTASLAWFDAQLK
ncbi:MAG: alpha/beta hydrolase [Verrucomicrobiales bacterium]|nr:alpha/beta hydrolase [Verrucomicrobiales bacterium]